MCLFVLCFVCLWCFGVCDAFRFCVIVACVVAFLFETVLYVLFCVCCVIVLFVWFVFVVSWFCSF